MDLEVLLTIAQIATAFAGFTGLITFFQRRDSNSWRRVDRTRFWFMIELSLAVLFLSFVPAVSKAIGGSPDVPWRFACALLASYTAIQATAMGLRTAKLTAEERGPSARLTIPVLSAGFLLSIATVGLASVGVGVHPGAGAYSLGLLWLLAAAAYQFIRIVSAGEPPIQG